MSHSWSLLLYIISNNYMRLNSTIKSDGLVKLELLWNSVFLLISLVLLSCHTNLLRNQLSVFLDKNFFLTSSSTASLVQAASSRHSSKQVLSPAQIHAQRTRAEPQPVVVTFSVQTWHPLKIFPPHPQCISRVCYTQTHVGQGAVPKCFLVLTVFASSLDCSPCSNQVRLGPT